MSGTGTPNWLKLLIQNSVAPLGTLLLVALVYQQTGSFTWAMVTLVGGLVVSFVIGIATDFFKAVWEKLRDRWSGLVADWIDTWIVFRLSGYRKWYLQHLIYRHRDFDVKGLTTQGIYALELEKVFVELSVDPKSLHHISTDPIQEIPEAMQEGSHTIWDFLQAETLRQQNLAVIGTPGSGKTTLLKHMALALAGGGDKPLKKLPILLFLRDHAAAIQKNKDLSLGQAVRDHLAKWEMDAPPGWFAAHLRKGTCLVMLDGLDEVADPTTRKAVVAWVEKQMQIHARNQFVITSRPFGYRSNPLSGVTVLEVRPFTHQQVEKFVQNWYLANEIMSAQNDDHGVYMKAREGANDLLKRLHKMPALTELAVNPLLLTMIATVHRYRSSLPGRRVELYAEICEVFLGKRQQARGLELVLTPAKKQRVLEPLAFEMMYRELREIGVDEASKAIAYALMLVNSETNPRTFLKMIENHSGLLIERENGIYSFSHLTFQEYLAAGYVKENGLGDELVEYVGESWWHETIRLYAAQADATSIIRACLFQKRPHPRSLTLAVQCLDEAMVVKPGVKKQVQFILQKGVEYKDSKVRESIAETLLMLRLHHLQPVDDNLYIDNTLITNAEYQLFIDEMRSQGKFHPSDHWQAAQFPSGTGNKPVVGVRSTDAEAFCGWLTRRDEGFWQYRLLVKQEAGKYSLDSEGEAGYWVNSGSSHVVETKGSPLISKTWLGRRLSLDHALARALDLDLDLARALKRDLEHDLIRACDLSLDLTRALDLAHNLSLDLARARDIARVLDLDLDLALKLDDARDRTLDLAHALEQACDLIWARDRARALARDLSLARSSSSDLSLARVRDLAHALARVLALDLDLSRAFDLGLDHSLDRARTRARALDLTRDHVLSLNRVQDPDFTLDLNRTLELAHTRALSLNHVLTRALNRNRNPSLANNARALDKKEAQGYRRYIRVVSLTTAAIIQQVVNAWEKKRSWADRLRQNSQEKEQIDELQALIDNYLDLYLDFAILEGRIEGELPAVEGIRIVKERKKE